MNEFITAPKDLNNGGGFIIVVFLIAVIGAIISITNILNIVS